MVNELQSQEWAYLLDPCFQLVNTNGKPLTNGHIEVFYHGTRTPYYCASDWNGTLHPFKIKIDSLGSNVVLADPNYAYDVYVYNAYGVLQMSRYNVNPGVAGSGGSSGEGGPAEHWSSDTAGGASTTVTGGTTVYLTLPSSEDQPDFVDHSTDTAIFLKEGLYHIDAVVSFKQDEDDLQNIIKDLVVNTGLSGWDAQMTGQKNWTGPESTDDDRHFLELHTVVSVPDDLLQPLYFQIASPVDLDSAAIEKLDIIKLEAGGNGIKYTGGYGIDITGQVISTSGMMPEASAANFVDVSTYNTDIENIYETIAETSAMIPSGVATEQFVEDFTSAFITEDSLDGYATQEWIEDQHYITSADIPPIPQDVITSGELATVSGEIVDLIPSLEGYATQQWVEDQNFITSADIPDIPEDVVTSGQLATVSAQIENEIPNYTATAPIAIDGSNNISLKYGNTLVLTNSSTTDTVETNGYGNMAWQVTGEPSESDNLQISSPSSLSVIGASAGNHLRLRIDLDDSDNFIDSKVNLLSGGQEITLDGTSQTIYGFQTPAGSTWSSIFDFSTHPISDLYASQAVYGEVLVELWEYNGDTPVRPQYGGSLRQWPWGITIQFTSSESGLNVANPLPSPGNIPNYVLTSNGNGGSYWAPPTSGDLPADLVTSAQLATVSGEIVNQIPDVSDMATQTWVGQQGFLTSIPDEYVTSGELATVSGEIMSQIPSPTTVSIDPTLSSGTKIAEFNINGTSGELYAPQGGGSEGGSLEAVSFPMVINDDKSYIAMRYSQRGLKAEITYTYYYPTMLSGKYIYPCIPWDMARSTTPGAVLRGSISIERTYSLTNCRVAWFPTTDTDKFLIDLRSKFSYGSGKSTSWAYCPPSTSPDYPVDTTNWTKVGDWSSITGPIINWYVGIVDVTDNTLYQITQLGYQRNANTLEPAIGQGLTWTSRTGYGAAPDQYDIAVTNPVPNVTNNQGYVLTENGDGTFGWAAPGGSVPEDVVTSGQLATVSAQIENDIPNYTAGDNISIVNDEISVSGTAGLIAGDNISITASGDNYIISSSGSGGGGSDVFWAVYDEYDFSACTPLQDIIDAYQAGKTVLLKIFEDTGVGDRYEVGYLSWISIANTEGWESTDFAIFTVNKEPGMESNDYVANTQCEYIKATRSNGWLKSRSVMIQDPSQATVGSVLTLTSNGSWPEAEWAPPAGGGGLDQVYHDAGLTGDGTSASPLSITSASNWTQAYDAINSSASYWNDAAGMNEYPISAGPGMSIEDVSGVTVFSPDVPYLTQAVGVDETVIYNGKLPNLNSNLTLTESWNNFKQIRVRGGDNTPEDHYYSSVSPSKAAFKISWAYNWMNEAYLKFSSTSDPKVWTYAANTYVHYTHTDTAVFVTQNDTTTLGSGCNFKIVGIGRISGGN